MGQTEPKILRLVLIFLPSAEEDGHDEYDGDHPLQNKPIRDRYSGHVISISANQRPVFRSRDPCISQSEASIQVK